MEFGIERGSGKSLRKTLSSPYDPPVHDLWEDGREVRRKAAEPLAHRLRPSTLDEVLGQDHLLGPEGVLRRIVDAGVVGSILLHGPPGTGKTTLALLVARALDAHLERENAAQIGVPRIREILAAADRRLGDSGRRTILFLDEIHRFSRSQQDVLLGDVERGAIALIGATTENPWYTVNAALTSRSTVLEVRSLEEDDVVRLLHRALAEPRGLGDWAVQIDDDAARHLAAISEGDARRALTALEVAARSLRPGRRDDPAATPVRIDLAVAASSIGSRPVVYDRTGDGHYDTISAFIKSMRGSDPDAAVYWLAKMLHAGEDPRFIARRIAILASEDIGQADPTAIQVANAAWSLVEKIGMPEAQLTLAQAAIHMAMAPKSPATSVAIWSAMSDVREGRTQPVPRELISGMKKGRAPDAADYRSPHTAADGVGTTDYLGVERVFYEPTERGAEAGQAERLDAVRSRRRADRGDGR
jgi:putative ATPase